MYKEDKIKELRNLNNQLYTVLKLSWYKKIKCIVVSNEIKITNLNYLWEEVSIIS